MMQKRILAGLLAACVLLSLSACGKPKTPKTPSSSEPLSVSSSQQAESAAPQKPDTETPEGVTGLALEAVKAMDIEALNKYSDNNGNIGAPKPEGATKDLMAAMFGSLTYSVGAAKVDGDTATVQAEITNKDLTDILVGKLIPALMGEVLQNGGKLDTDTDRYITMMVGFISEVEGTRTATVDVSLNKKDGLWQVHLDEALMDALCGGLLGSVQEMADKLGGMGIDIGSMLG